MTKVPSLPPAVAARLSAFAVAFADHQFTGADSLAASSERDPGALGTLSVDLFRSLPEALPEDWRCVAVCLAGLLAERRAALRRPLLYGLAGGQGAGKSTLARTLVSALQGLGLRAASLSLDDVYLTRAARSDLAATVHPLLQTRGVPGTHDLALLETVLEQLARPELRLPAFDKGRDDRQPETAWPTAAGPIDVLVLEGWCLGTSAEPASALLAPANALERDEDADGRYRRYVNTAIASRYEPLWQRLDGWLFLAVPSFAAVTRWRTQQEQALPAAQRMSAAALDRFVAHYQRLTDHLLRTAPAQASATLQLNEQHRVEFREGSAAST